MHPFRYNLDRCYSYKSVQWHTPDIRTTIWPWP